MTRLSVVMSVYDGVDQLAATLDSILAQTFADFELIAVDDGSTDGAAAMLDAYASRDPRVRVIHQENTGLTRALIAGCAAARGEYIARHDAGDLSHPQRFEKQLRMLDAAPEVAFVSCATQYAGPELEPLWVMHPKVLAPADVMGDVRLTEGPTHHGSAMFRRDAYERAGGYRAAFYYGQDYDLWYRLAALGRYQAIDEVLYTARIAPSSISSAARPEQERLARLSEAALAARKRGDSEAAILEEASRIRPVRKRPSRRIRAAGLYFIGEALRRNRDPRARAYLRQALRLWPLSPRAWVRLAQAAVTRSAIRAALPPLLSRMPRVRGLGRLTLLLDRALTNANDPRSYETTGTLNDGARFHFDLRPWGQKFAYYYRRWERDEIRKLRSLYRGGWFVDIGSSLGLYVVCMADAVRGAGGRIAAIEPVPFNLERQRANIALSRLEDLVEVVQVALGERPGSLHLAVDPLGADNNAFVCDSGIEVPVTTFDELAAARHWSPIGVIKMDVEGYEPAVIAGARETIARERPVILAELNRERMVINGFTIDETWDFLHGLGYEAFVLRRGKLVRVHEAASHEDLFFIPPRVGR